MPPEDRTRQSEREQTDESLRVEREKADRALGDELTALDDAADAVISRARARADAVLAAARARTDRQPVETSSGAPAPAKLERERRREDQAVRKERADADETVLEERAEHTALLKSERDETDKDLLSERARSDDALATRDDFLATVSHDLLNMLNAMVGFAALIAKDVLQENHVDRVLVHAQRIQRSGGRMSRLIGDLIDVASIEAGALAVHRELGDPTPVVMEAVETFQPQATASGITIEVDIGRPSLRAAFDPARILQVLTNLLSNAIKFTPAHGTVCVRVERVAEDIRFTVSDTGVGIPVDRLEEVFERFVQLDRTDRRGVGLGLYISKAIVQGHGGRIWVESAPGEGSSFSFTLAANR